ncbi:MAG: sensor histidine kinase [Paenibacillaceae bacterium]|nr:sensor histidine kinase [Paenibacillaceae bacterium]
MKQRSIRVKMVFASMLLTIVLFSVTAIVSYSLSVGKIERQRQEQLFHVQKQVEEHLETVFNQVEKIVLLFSKNNELLQNIAQSPVDLVDIIGRKTALESMFTNSINYDHDIESILLSMPAGDVFLGSTINLGLFQSDINKLNYFKLLDIYDINRSWDEQWIVLPDKPRSDKLQVPPYFDRYFKNRFVYVKKFADNATMMIVLNPDLLLQSIDTGSVFHYSLIPQQQMKPPAGDTAPSPAAGSNNAGYKLVVEGDDPAYAAMKLHYRNRLALTVVLLALAALAFSAWFSRRMLLPFAFMRRQVGELNVIETPDDFTRLRPSTKTPAGFRLRLFVFLLAECIVGMLLLFLVHYYFSYQMLKINLESYYKEFVAQSEGSIEKNIDYIESGINYIVRDPLIQNLLLGDHSQAELAGELKKLFSFQHVISKNINYLNIYNKQGEFMFSTINNLVNEMNIQQHGIFPLLEKTEGESVFINENKDEFGDHVVLAAKKIYSLTDARVLLGYQLYSINERQLEALSGNLGIPSLELVIRDPTGAVIYRKENQTGGTASLVLGETMHKLNWTIASTFDQTDLFSGTKEIALVNGYLLLAVMLAILLITYMLARRIAEPIEKLARQIRQTVASDFADNPISRFRGTDEIGELSAHISAMIDRIKVLMSNIYSIEVINREIQLAYKKAELSNLLHQMNPHFLYNTLETIRWMAMKLTRGENDVSRIIGELSIYLRSGNYSDNKIVRVKEELIHVKSYLYIQQIRYGNRLSVKWSIDAEAENERMVRFVLQPLVENALIHGIDKSERNGMLFIGVSVREGVIRLCVADNGCGLAADRLAAVRESLADKKADDHIGLRNIAQRLSLYHGDKGRMTVASKQHHWTKVEIEVPIAHDENGA